MSYTSDYLNVHDNPSLLIPLLSKVQQEIHALDSNEVGSLTSYLLADLDIKNEWDDKVITKVLLTLKHLGRRMDDSDMLYKKQGFHILMKWTGLLEKTQVVDTSVSQEALKCLANCILLSGDTMKSWLIETKNALGTCVRLLHSDLVSVDIQFLICRLLYLMTYGDGPCIVNTLMDLDLSNALAKILSRQVQGWLQDPAAYSSPTTSQPTTLVCEVLKLQRSIMIILQDIKTTTNPEDTDSTLLSIKEEVAERFTENLTPILDILYILPYPTPLPLIPTSPFVNAIFVLNLYTYNQIRAGWYYSPRLAPYCDNRETALTFCATSLHSVLEQTLMYLMPPRRPISSSSTLTVTETFSRPSSGIFLDGWKSLKNTDADDDLDRALALILSYLMSTLVFVDEVLPELRHSLISADPTCHFFPRLVKLLSSTRFPQARDMAGELLYHHVDEDASAFIDLVGYDNAKRTLEAKDHDLDQPIAPPPTNPTDDDDSIQLSEMTNEEKEREAERLFVMFERIQLQD